MSEHISEPGIDGFLHLPQGRPERGLVLTHGAGANCQTALLVKVADAFCASGFAVLRCNLAFRQRRPTGPPFPAGAADDRASLRAAIGALSQRVPSLSPGHIVLGGHSYGGRQATMLAAEDPHCAAALLLLSYPLHPPGKPEQPRTGHFPQIEIASLFVHGTRDPFGSPDEVRQAIALIAAPVLLSLVDRAGHDLQPKQLEIQKLILGPLTELMA